MADEHGRPTSPMCVTREYTPSVGLPFSIDVYVLLHKSSLAACVGADRLQDRCADVQSSSWRRAAVSGAAHLCRWPSQSLGSAVGCHQWLGCAIYQTVNCRQLSFSGCPPPPGSGILYRSTLSRQQHFSLSRSTWKRSYCNDRNSLAL